MENLAGKPEKAVYIQNIWREKRNYSYSGGLGGKCGRET